MTETLAAYSLVAVYSAIAVYALAFIAYAIDLAKRSASAQARARVPPPRSSASASVESMLDRPEPPACSSAPRSPPAASGAQPLPARRHRAHRPRVGAARRRRRAARHRRRARAVGQHVRVRPDRHRLMVGVFLVVNFWRDLRFLGAFITGLVVMLLGLATVNFYVDVAPLPPALQSAWLVIHVFVATLGTGFFALGAGLSIAQLLQARREARQAAELAASCARFPTLDGARDARLPRQRHRLHLLDLHPHRRRHLGRARLGPLLGLGHQGGLDLHHLGALRRLHPRPCDPRLARLALGLARDHRLHRRAVQLHHREPVLQGPARLLGL